jgi:hypothetical protein
MNRVGWVRTGGAATARWMRQTQIGRNAQHTLVASSNTTALPTIGSGSSGNTATPVFTTLSTANFVPASASRIRGAMINQNNGSAVAILAPDAHYGAAGSPPINMNITASNISLAFDFLLESTAQFYASNSASVAVYVLDWEDNL